MGFDARGFRTTSEDVVHEWAMFQLVRRVVASPGGETFERTYVRTPGAVATVAVTADDKVVMVEQYRAALGGYVLEIPAGMRDVEGEDPMDTAMRELREEAGYEAGRIELLGTCLSSPGVTDSTVIVYLATQLRGVGTAPHGPEERAMSLVTLDFADVVSMVLDGSIQDAKSAYGILMAHHRLTRGAR
jgi:ADP-ribose pyrophosphatase